MSVKCIKCGYDSVDVCMKDAPYAPIQSFSCRCLHCNTMWFSTDIDDSIFSWFKVWVPIVDNEGNVVDHYRHDWSEHPDWKTAKLSGYEGACVENWGENNEFTPSFEGIEVECAE